ncbi:MAG: hypothetical protein E5Y38_29940 [Mesorhizobium sp.]|uniref:hypothetical protein n=1 Tax=Mesorhizobium sp. TaxID=1871066 RepID=UPI0012114B81|nr:hypothetical protein [Mesorhizobium sp.]TIM93732.1 MAG: hypothetical protein E5Y38_29940 [Mesorhizobium sp.]
MRQHGQGSGHLLQQRPAHLACARAQAAPDQGAKSLKALEYENAKLKKLLAGQLLEAGAGRKLIRLAARQLT